jgi:hypothetical protein
MRWNVTLWRVDKKYLKNFEIWCWRGMEKSVESIKWETKKCYWDNEERNILETMGRRKATRIGRILRKNCLLKRCCWRKDMENFYVMAPIKDTSFYSTSNYWNKIMRYQDEFQQHSLMLLENSSCRFLPVLSWDRVVKMRGVWRCTSMVLMGTGCPVFRLLHF